MDDSEMDRSITEAGKIRSWAASHRGTVRGHNEDRFVNRADLGLWAVADGAGGHEAGQVASSMVAEALQSMPGGLAPGAMVKHVRERLGESHLALREQASHLHANAMIATTVVVLLVSDSHYACLWVGDSRIYLLRNQTLKRVTRDHSLVQELIDSGAITEEQAEHHPRANIITRAIGADSEELDIDMVTDRLYPGDRFLLCSDGLTKCVGEPEIAVLLAADEDSPAERLLLAALARSATDNVTAVAVEVTE